ncbi:MAG: hypothetical protein ACRDZO_20625 [Egibacteraceae bacterium]
MRRRILLISALSAATIMIAAPAAFAQSQPAADLDLGNLIRILAGAFPTLGNFLAGLA